MVFSRQSASVSRASTRWSPPPQGGCKINTDGAREGATGFASCGGVLHSWRGDWLFGFSRSIGIWSVMEAELWGVHEGLVHAWNSGERRVILEIDSLETSGVLDRKRGAGVSFTLYDRIAALLERDWIMEIRHIGRVANQAADNLEKMVDVGGAEAYEFHDPPCMYSANSSVGLLWGRCSYCLMFLTPLFTKKKKILLK
ncbi:hypothetical protein F3Y22_tig00010865pilonHSYRG00038 [Hibiscus syriacus]|uniref:RNase H type-1 domain-containing protein n=1 Tax=Hibiscus syriacus TaxID=106335 RepID=A0A6A3CAC8_HIBSY|nr:hypothetical protein F3Y22_tig00010865pilonHSYRG00038 [Hibiscus syriacus]